MFELQVDEGDAHGRRELRSVLALHFDAVSSAIFDQEEIQLRALVRGPEIRLVRLHGLQRLFDGVPFPRRAALGMRQQLLLTSNPQ